MYCIKAAVILSLNSFSPLTPTKRMPSHLQKVIRTRKLRKLHKTQSHMQLHLGKCQGMVRNNQESKSLICHMKHANNIMRSEEDHHPEFIIKSDFICSILINEIHWDDVHSTIHSGQWLEGPRKQVWMGDSKHEIAYKVINDNDLNLFFATSNWFWEIAFPLSPSHYMAEYIWQILFWLVSNSDCHCGTCTPWCVQIVEVISTLLGAKFSCIFHTIIHTNHICWALCTGTNQIHSTGIVGRPGWRG